MKEIKYIRTDNNLYIHYKKNNSDLTGILINGEYPKETYNPEWKSIKGTVINKVEIKQSQPAINKRYILKDMSLKSDKILESFPYEDKYTDETHDYYTEYYDTYSSLYEYIEDAQPDLIIDVEYATTELLYVKEIPNAQLPDYSIMKTQWEKDGTRMISESDIKHQIIDEIVYPSLILHTRPEKISKQTTFDIIREYVKNNIDPKNARITADYNFCFTVKKVLPLPKPIKYTVDVNNNIFQKRKKKPKYETRYQKESLVEVFAMAPKTYQSYPVIQEFQGCNREELLQNINEYCEDIIKMINEPLKVCHHCHGKGVESNEN